jgi:hypothetical protein
MLDQFGYNSIAPRGVRTIGFKPLLVVLVQGEGRPMLANDKAYYEDFFFGPKNSVSSYFQEISHGRFTWTRLGAGILGPLKLSPQEMALTLEKRFPC